MLSSPTLQARIDASPSENEARIRLFEVPVPILLDAQGLYEMRQLQLQIIEHATCPRKDGKQPGGRPRSSPLTIPLRFAVLVRLSTTARDPRLGVHATKWVTLLRRGFRARCGGGGSSCVSHRFQAPENAFGQLPLLSRRQSAGQVCHGSESNLVRLAWFPGRSVDVELAASSAGRRIATRPLSGFDS
jgi:hypothetical protein